MDFEDQKIEISEFNIDKTFINSSQNNPPVILIIGGKQTGKTFLANDLVYKQNYQNGLIVLPNKSVKHEYQVLFNKSVTFQEEYKGEIVENILNKQKYIINESKNYRTNKKDTSFFAIFDECINKDWSQDKALKKLLINGSYLNTMQLYILSSPDQIPNNQLNNIDYIFILNDDSIPNVVKMYENFGNIFPSFESFQIIYNNLTKNKNECMVIDNTIKTNIVSNKIFWYKASLY